MKSKVTPPIKVTIESIVNPVWIEHCNSSDVFQRKLLETPLVVASETRGNKGQQPTLKTSREFLSIMGLVNQNAAAS